LHKDTGHRRRGTGRPLALLPHAAHVASGPNWEPEGRKPVQSFDSDGVRIVYADEGEGFPTLLIHGFGSNHRVNWASTSWTRDLLAAGRRVVAFDNRGHGESGKPHDVAAYRIATMAEDARRLLDHLNIERADVIGYSMGGRIAAALASLHPERVRRVVIGGIGAAMLRGPEGWEVVAAALRAPSLDDVTDPRARTYRVFAEQTKSDREALAACILGSRDPLTPQDAARITAPVLIAIGSDDEVSGKPEPLAALIRNAETFVIPGRDHMKAVGDKRHKQAAIEFLSG
jgi:pimeloyl-ACP methyl ester carboxylesterase